MKTTKNPMYAALLTLILSLTSCYPDEVLKEPVKEPELTPKTELDIYIQKNFTDKWGMVIAYRFVDHLVAPNQRATPPRINTVRPMLDFIQKFWIDPYLEVPNGEPFFSENVPAQIILLGGLIYEPDGTVILGLADAGARITFTNVNAIDPSDDRWRTLQLRTVYHEFAHTVHQKFKLPDAFETISPEGYTSAGSWFALDDSEALISGFVSPYATSNPNEDFAETVASFLSDPNFFADYITPNPNCATRTCLAENAGKILVAEKTVAIIDHYEQVTGVSLVALRRNIQEKIRRL